MNIEGRAQLKLLCNYLEKNHPNNVLMPGLIRKNEKGENYKAPLFPHKDGTWTPLSSAKADEREHQRRAL